MASRRRQGGGCFCWVRTASGAEGYVNAQIRPKVQGYLLKQVYKNGAEVEAGELMFTIDPRQFQADVKDAQGNLKRQQAALKRRSPFMHSAIPTHSAGKGGGVVPARLPTQLMMGFVNLQVEKVGFVGCGGNTLINPLPRPVLQHRGNKLTNRAIAFDIRAEVEGFAGRMWIE